MRIDRLKQLLAHMRGPNRGHDFFNFGCFSKDKVIVGMVCGTSGCMAGELPTLFPKDWGFRQCGEPYRPLLTQRASDAESDEFDEWSSESDPSTHLAVYFELQDDQVDHLFYPDCQNADWGAPLNSRSPLDDVLVNLERFIMLFENVPA